ncbi:hypothetical protein M4951_16550 [Blastopirellula sp. J2-11]|uniref:hypothetical protein n=1 Tax=Blastopirellula sp. J2-11 TaxID=2943192 RepID=UPI0021C9E52F|nr:hypothetical protein [Blastopirellula sp. J2-11]UUO04990.1 hypothetical protein M4951_16550 [Blastopirellula sp. J2-11]
MELTSYDTDTTISSYKIAVLSELITENYLFMFYRSAATCFVLRIWAHRRGVSPWLAVCALIAVPLSVSDVFAIELSERFYVPVNGHVVCSRSAITRRIEGLQLDSIEDVVEFYERHKSFGFRDAKPSWDFVSEFGLNLQEAPPVSLEGLPGGKSHVTDRPDWIQSDVYFDGKSYSISEQFGGKESGRGIRQVRTSKGVASVSQQGKVDQITHSSGPFAMERHLGTAELFSRSSVWFSGDAVERRIGQFTLYSINRGAATQHFLADHDSDSIFASVTTRTATGEPRIVRFHFGHHDVRAPVPHTSPAITVELRKGSAPNQWSCSPYFIKRADLDAPIAATAFAVPASAGDTYVEVNPTNSTAQVEKIRREYKDVMKELPDGIILHPQENAVLEGRWGWRVTLLVVNAIVLAGLVYYWLKYKRS